MNEMPRDLIRFTVREAGTGDPVSDGYWSDVGTRDIPVTDPITGATQTYTFHGAGSLIETSPIPGVMGLTVQPVTVRISQIDERINDLLRGHDINLAPVTIWRGYIDPDTGDFDGPARVLFHGVLNYVEVETPAAGGVGFVVCEIAPATEELTRANGDMRSDASQRMRSATDNFFEDVSTAGDWQINWGGERRRFRE